MKQRSRSLDGGSLRLLVIIINYKTPGLVCDAVLSLHKDLDPELDRVVIVDNLSEDESINVLSNFIDKNKFDSWVEIVESGVNGGFSSGNNIGLMHAKAEYYLLLNSDAYVREGAIRALFSSAASDARLGIIAPKLEWDDGRQQVSLFHHLTVWNSFLSSAKTGLFTRLGRIVGLKEVAIPIDKHYELVGPDWVSFACVLLRGAMVDEVGLMDDGFFMYREDNDYCRRATQAGWKIGYAPEAKVVHLNQGASNDFGVSRLPTFYFESRSRYFLKYYGRLGLLCANLLWLLGRSISLFREVVQSKESAFHRTMIGDIWIGFFSRIDKNE